MASGIPESSKGAGSIGPYLAPGESVTTTYQGEPEHENDHPPFYALTDRRFIEISKQSENSEETVSVEAYPLAESTTIHIDRTEEGSGLDSEYGLAAAISGLFGLFIMVFPSSGAQKLGLFMMGGLFLTVAILLALIGWDNGSGEVVLQIEQKRDSKSVTLPLAAQEFVESVASGVGAHQS
ncbi:hypothetical protein GCM10028857_06450 [Salinarchaeum chitinilyticum]